MSQPNPTTDARTLGDILVEETTAFFRPLKTAAQDPEALSEFLLTLFPKVSQGELDALETAAQDLAAEVDQLPNRLSSDSPTWVDLLDLLADVADLLNAVLAFQDVLQGPDVAGAGKTLLDRLFVDYLQSEHPSLLYVGILLTLVEWPAPDAGARQAIDRSGTLYALSGRATPRLDRLPDLLSDPVGTLRDGHLSDPPTDADLRRLETLLFPWFSGLVEVVGSGDEYVFVPESNDTSQLPDYDFAEYTWTVYRTANGGLTRLGFVSLVYTDDGIGLAIQPEADFDTQFTADDWEFVLELKTALNAVVVDRNGLSFSDGSSGTVTGSVDVTKNPPAGADSLFVLGPPDGTRLELGRFESHASLTAGTDTVEADVLAAMRDSEFVFTPDDGFLAALLPEEGAGATFDLGVGWSTAKGVYLDGSGSLTATFSMKKLMSAVGGNGGDAGGGDDGGSSASGGGGGSGGSGGGGVDAGASIDMVHVSAEPKGDRIPVDVTVTASGHLGPVAATIEQFGLEAVLSFPDEGGNLGVANVDIGVSPPKGIGLSVDASAVVGGGYLSFDPEHGRYTGALTLKVGELTLNAIGLLTTGTADGEGGFSLLVIITADFPPVQLGFGFTLNAVGGLLGVNRAARVEPLRAGVRDGSLKSVLFPEDPVRNAPQLVSDLRRFFPRVDGQYIFGPMAELGWGTPTILRAQVGVLVEIPAPLRLAILGRIEAVLPDEEAALIALRMNALGVIDIGGKSVSVDASLYDSRVVTYALTGDMAMRSRWGDDAMFGLSVGGFHPKFDPPPAFPDLRRVAISLSAGNNPRLRLSGYFAVTSNTVQAGAHVDLYARAAGFRVDGHLGFDALFQFDPFEFVVDVAAGISVKGHGISLGIHLSGSLSGPSPWHIKGKATVDLFLISATVRVEATMGEDRQGGSLPPADVYGKVRQALSRPGNWTGQRPEGGESIVSLREIEPGDGEVLAHPLGSLSVRQRIAPLGVAIETFGTAKPANYSEFAVDSVTVAGQPDEDLSGAGVREQFAPAQFFELTDSEKLSRPSFERFEAGHDVTNGLLAFGGQSGGNDGELGPEAASETLTFESTYVDRNRDAEGTLSTTKLTVGAADALAASSAVAKAETRTAGNAQFETATPDAVSISDTSYVVVDSETLARVEAPALPGESGTTRTEAEQAMAAYVDDGPGEADALRVVATHEAAAPDGGNS